ncbi:MAG: PAS domain S-box protein, partial [Flavisolibacter sp.]|nr:PAS domain S-box protein [Flavisolibacter sp.]
ILAVIFKIFETGEPFIGIEIPATVNIKGGTRLRYYNLSYTPLFEAGVVTGILEVATDVTEQVLARKELEESQEALKRFKFMADQARDAFLLMREDGTFAYLNPKALESWGYTEEEAKLLRVPDIDPNYNIELFSQLFALAQKGNIPIVNSQHKRKDGSVYPIEASLSRVVISGEPHLFGVGRDITERKLAEEALEQKNAQLIRINNDLDNFIYTASHDLKAPISNIEALLQALLRTLPQESLESERAQRITNLMQDSVDRFKKTIANLTEVIKLQKENNEEAISVNLDEVIHEVILDLEPLIQSTGTVINIDTQVCNRIHFSEKNLRSVVYNLLSNGIKYRSSDRLPKLEVSCKKLPGFHVLTISDNGLGLKEFQLANLFSMFKRFHVHVEGTGIGLYMVKKMVENVGGHIKVESKEGIGTTFSVYFPA